MRLEARGSNQAEPLASLTYTKHADLDNLKAPVHDFVTNPLVYISHQDRLLEAKEAVIEAYTLKATQETYFII